MDILRLILAKGNDRSKTIILRDLPAQAPLTIRQPKSNKCSVLFHEVIGTLGVHNT